MQLPVERVHSSWLPLFEQELELLNTIFAAISSESLTPTLDRIFRAFEYPLADVRVVIFGQDPYPGLGIADGLAFSSFPNQPIPASLRNIFKEYEGDVGLPAPKNPDLSKWSEDGVMLLNRSLSTSEGERNAHVSIGWRKFTIEVARVLAEREVVAILWGNNARELAPLFKYRIESAHPSPLSAHRGFFKSRPFTAANKMLMDLGRTPIDWNL